MKYVIGGAGIVIILALFIWIIFAVVNRSDDMPEVDETEIVLSETNEQGSQVQFTTYGAIVADEEFRAIRFTFDQQQRVMEVLNGYTLAIQDSYEFPNTAAAYETFLFALENEGFMNSQLSEFESERGLCSAGTRSVYELFIDGESEHRTWSTSCRSTKGTFAGNARSIERLFQAQIPDYRELTRQVRL